MSQGSTEIELPEVDWKRETPVAFFIFKRPETAARVFKAISRARPKKLFIIADGPRKGRADEEEACRQVRSLVETIPWDCEVLRNYAETNLGCNERISSGLGWLFKHVEEAIILEDDCLPSPSFFRFAEEMLERYRDHPRIFNICGAHCIPFSSFSSKESYFFSTSFAVWGWATWRRAWKYFPGIEPESVRSALPFKETASAINAVSATPRVRRHFLQILRLISQGKAAGITWDYIWGLTCLKNQGLSIRPRRNLISNIGFAHGATNPADPSSPANNFPLDSLSFPLTHPSSIIVDKAQDLSLELNFPPPRNLEWKLQAKILLPTGIYLKMRDAFRFMKRVF
jgi:hypothetical protein